VPQWLWRKIGATITWTANVIIQPTAELAQIRQLLDDRWHNLQFQTDVNQPALPQVVAISELMGEFSWAIAVDKALQLIQQGQLEKLVLARFLDIEAESAIHLPLVLANLQQNYAECTVFCFDLLPHSYLVGASPELLLHSQFQHNQLLIETLALAGSIPRGNSPTRDQILGAQLLHSAKDLQEHQIVINSIVQALAKIKADIAPIAPPQLMPLANVQHLCTPITAKISTAEPLDIFDLMAELHPTAAMAGSPKDFALPLMQRYEPSDRGWYAAPLGWLDCLGNAMFVVCIRSALISANKARLFAGSGIIANSNIQQEIIETNAKFNPILHALGIKEFA
jgi:menaquinone-specific isochorismate synthase